MKKKIASVLLIVTVALFSSIPISATGVSPQLIEITPFWQNIERITMSMSFSNNTATVSATISGNRDTSSISATFSLQERVGNRWETIHNWPSESTTSRDLEFSGTATVTRGRTYRFTVTTTVTNAAGNRETVTQHHERVFS